MKCAYPTDRTEEVKWTQESSINKNLLQNGRRSCGDELAGGGQQSVTLSLEASKRVEEKAQRSGDEWETSQVPLTADMC